MDDEPALLLLGVEGRGARSDEHQRQVRHETCRDDEPHNDQCGHETFSRSR
jgi:hypothetical protein